MKILILENNVIDINTLNEGVALAKQYALTIGLDLEFTQKVSTTVFNSYSYQGSANVGLTATVLPQEILNETPIGYDVGCLVYDWTKVNGPQPKNPSDAFEIVNGVNPMCIPTEWFTNAPDTFASFLIHELCHMESFKNHKTDITHLLTDGTLQAQNPILYAKFAVLQPKDWYLYLLNALINVPNEPTLPPDDPSHMFNTQTGALNPRYTGLQAPVNVVTPQSDKIALWCAAIKQMEGAKPELNNPGNLRFVGQQFAINNGGFCQFDTYDHGEQALRTLLVNACSGKSSIYNPNGTLYDFYAKYAPSSDNNNPNHYAEFVAKYIGVLPTVIIKTLL